MQVKNFRGIWFVRFRHRGKEFLRSLKIKAIPGQLPSQKVIRKGNELYRKITQGENQSFRKNVEFSVLGERYLSLHVWVKCKNPKRLEYQINRPIEFFGRYRPWEIDKELIVQYEKRRIATGIKLSTLNREKQYLRAILIFGAKLKLISRSEASDVIDLLEYEDEQQFVRNRNVSTDELKDIVLKCPIHAAVAVILASVCMARLGEIMKAKWKEVDWDSRTLFLGKNKNGDPRYAPLAINHLNGHVDMETLKILKIWGAYQKDLSRKKGYPAPDSVITFHGLPISTIHHAFCRAREGAKAQDVHFHDLRHLATTRFKRIGHDDNLIRRGSGHKDPASYNRYLDYSRNIDTLTGVGLGDRVQGTFSCEDFITAFKLEKYRGLVAEKIRLAV